MSNTIVGREIDARKQIANEPELLAQGRAALAAANSASAATLQGLIDLGRIGREVESDPSRWGPVPTQISSAAALELLARSLGVHRTMLGEARRIVSVFPDDVLDSFLKRYSVTGHLITLEHVRIIMRLPATQREVLIAYFYEHSATPGQLRTQIRKLRGKKRTLPAPQASNFDGAIIQLNSMASRLGAQLTGNLQVVLFDRLREFAAGAGAPRPDDPAKVAALLATITALRDNLNAAVEITGRAAASLAERPGGALAIVSPRSD